MASLVPDPDIATLLRNGLALCKRPTCGHERRWHTPCTVLGKAIGKKTPPICACPAFVE